MITDGRTGLVTALHHERLPVGLHVTHADLAFLGPAGGRPTVSGASWTCPDAATAAALGEAMERYCGHRTRLLRDVYGVSAGVTDDGGRLRLRLPEPAHRRGRGAAGCPLVPGRADAGR
ncbi:hypothetical protein [Micromonospora sp. KC213]|uniref:hypothetical protein n=1 Tax=Micromonospora sp. KC213 TaxID=2530378 RepID=UPI001FB847FF|nr:hypothetical protein [Micromonospora sp. KC213]